MSGECAALRTARLKSQYFSAVAKRRQPGRSSQNHGAILSVYAVLHTMQSLFELSHWGPCFLERSQCPSAVIPYHDEGKVKLDFVQSGPFL